jgi:small acid-soluble spore protein D (minor alpha/beta-type SASP)
MDPPALGLALKRTSLIVVLPNVAFISEKKHLYFFLFRQSYVCGNKDVFFGNRLWLSEEIRKKERNIMKNNNQINIPQAREAMDKFKMQAASEVGVNLTNGYNGHLTSREAGSVGGQMVKKMIEAYEQGLQ